MVGGRPPSGLNGHPHSPVGGGWWVTPPPHRVGGLPRPATRFGGRRRAGGDSGAVRHGPRAGVVPRHAGVPREAPCML